MILNIKPLSVNQAWRGRRFKTEKYKAYQRDVLLILPNSNVCNNTSTKIKDAEKLKILFIFGFSNKGSDVDNPLKPIIDVLQKKYEFNDSIIYELNVKKQIVKKGDEFIKIRIEEI